MSLLRAISTIGTLPGGAALADSERCRLPSRTALSSGIAEAECMAAHNTKGRLAWQGVCLLLELKFVRTHNATHEQMMQFSSTPQGVKCRLMLRQVQARAASESAWHKTVHLAISSWDLASPTGRHISLVYPSYANGPEAATVNVFLFHTSLQTGCSALDHMANHNRDTG